VRLAEKYHPEIEFEFELIDIARWNRPILSESVPAKAHSYQHDHTKRWSTKMSEANGYVSVTPEYNHGYPASLKNALGYLYHEWNGKPVALVGYSWGGGDWSLNSYGKS
jgi:NAD(P)H-dependent FMN reductase